MIMSSDNRTTKDEGFGREVGDSDLDLLRITSLGGGESRTTQYTGTKALMLAILEDGIRSFLSPVGRVRSEAEFWVRSVRNRSPFSFHDHRSPFTVHRSPQTHEDGYRRLL